MSKSPPVRGRSFVASLTIRNGILWSGSLSVMKLEREAETLEGEVRRRLACRRDAEAVGDRQLVDLPAAAREAPDRRLGLRGRQHGAVLQRDQPLAVEVLAGERRPVGPREARVALAGRASARGRGEAEQRGEGARERAGRHEAGSKRRVHAAV
jgi:hypothetical protein